MKETVQRPEEVNSEGHKADNVSFASAAVALVSQPTGSALRGRSVICSVLLHLVGRTCINAQMRICKSS